MQQVYATNHGRRTSPRARRRRRKRLVRRGVFAVLALALCAAAIYGCVRAVGRLFPTAGQRQAAQYLSQIETRDDIPQSLLDLAERNPEATEFVAGWPGSEPAGDVKLDVTAGQIPQLLQWDARWGYERYGDDYMAVTGCAPTCLAMVAAGLTGDGGITPLYAARVAEDGSYYMPGTGTSWDYMTSGAARLGVYGQELSLAQGTVDAYLADGLPVVCSVRPGDFTTAGHYIVLAGRHEDGGYRVYDPNSPTRSAQSWSWETLEPQIKNLWGYSLA